MKSIQVTCKSVGPVKVTKTCLENWFMEVLKHYQLSLEICRGLVT